MANVNGTTLGYKTGVATEYTLLNDLKEIPEMGGEPEMIENTPLSAKTKQYEQGVGDAGDLTYIFKYDNSTANSSFRIIKGFAEAGTVVDWEETLSDGTKFRYKGQCSYKLTGGALNSVIDVQMKIILQSDIDVVDPV